MLSCIPLFEKCEIGQVPCTLHALSFTVYPMPVGDFYQQVVGGVYSLHRFCNHVPQTLL